MSLQPGSNVSSWPQLHGTPGAFPTTPNSEHQQRIISAPQSLSQAVKARKSEFIRKSNIRIKVGSWNVASIKGTEKDLGAWFVEGLGVKGLSRDLAALSVEGSAEGLVQTSDIESVEDQEGRHRKRIVTVPKNDIPAVPGGTNIGLYVLGLQEIVDITSATEAIRQYTDTHASKKWKRTLEKVLPAGYVLVAEQQLLGLLLLIYASNEVSQNIKSVSTTSVGTGVLGYLGNKGAVSARIVLGETTRLVFINCHLAAGSDKAALERRNWDAGQVNSRTKFTPVTHDEEVAEEFEESIGDEDFAFWFGDLNYRLADMPGEDVRRLLLLHTRNEYDIANKSRRKIDSELGYVDAPNSSGAEEEEEGPETPDSDSSPLDPTIDPTSLHTTLQSLLPHDELRIQQKLRKAFHNGWREGEINFLPTYKYDVGSVGMFDSGEKKRGPSWCDRILFRTRRDLLEYEQKVKEEEEAKKKDAEMKSKGLDQAVSDDDVLFDYNPENDGLIYGDDCDEAEDNAEAAYLVQTQEGYEDSISIDHYISHQRVLSSDHKPLDAVFTLTYDSIIPELRSKVQQEVARELDKAENEGRPSITLVVDQPSEQSGTNAEKSAEADNLDGVSFGLIKFLVAKSCGLTIANTGRVPASFCFIDRPATEQQPIGIAPPWLGIQVQDDHDASMMTQKDYHLPPGEALHLKLTVNITDFDHAHQLNIGTSRIDDILVLRVHEGRDHFIPIRGNWAPSCFCRSLNELTKFSKGGAREVQQTKVVAVGNSSAKQSARLSAPQELFTLTNSIQELTERAIAEWEMTNEGQQPPWKGEGISAGWPFEQHTWTLPAGAARDALGASVREALDTATPIKDHFPPETSALVRLEILAETLILFLQCLGDGIVTVSLWSKLESMLTSRERSKSRLSDDEKQASVLEILSSSPVHSVSFTFLTFMLVRVAGEVVPVSSGKSETMRSPRQSTSSMQSPVEDTDTAPSSPDKSPGKTSVFQSLRRRARASISTSSDGESKAVMAAMQRRSVEQAYARIFGPVMIRSDPSTLKERGRKQIDERKAMVLDPFLTSGP